MARALARLERFLAARARRRALEAASSAAPAAAAPARSFSAATAAAETTPTAADLTTAGARGVLRLSGNGALQFLQGMVTNDMRPLMGRAPARAVAYAALLTPKGKLIEDVFVHRCMPLSSLSSDPSVVSASAGGTDKQAEEEEETLFLDVGAASKREALAWLARYRLRRPLALDDVSSDLHAWAAWGENSAAAAAAALPPPPPPSTAAAGVGWRADPRLPGGALGWRGVFAAAAGDSAASTATAAAAAVAAAGHRRLRYALAVPEGAVEMLSAAAAAGGGGSGGADGGGGSSAASPPSASQQQRAPNPLEFGLDALNGVSYDKGCYIGQERNSFTHYRGVLRRRALTVRLVFGGGGSTNTSNAASLAGSPIVDPSDGRAVGTLMAAEGDLGLAHLLLARALPAGGGEAAAAERRVPAAFVVAGSGGGGGEEARVVPLGRPAWWPRDWGREEAAAAAGTQDQQQA